MDDKLIVTIDGLKMFGRPGLGPFGIVKDGLDGWEDGVDMRGDKTAYPQGHGSYPLPRYRESRTVTINGLISADSAAEHAVARRRLSGLLAGGGSGRIQVEQDEGIQWAEVSLDHVSIDRRRGQHRSDFQLQLYCADSRKFGDTESFTANQNTTLPLYHRGNIDAHPYVIIRGDLPTGYSLLGPNGEEFEVTTSVITATKPHAVDFSDGILLVNGVISSISTQLADVWSVPPGGESTIRLVPNSGTNGTLEVLVTDTYV